jgi:hypothetical protein
LVEVGLHLSERAWERLCLTAFLQVVRVFDRIRPPLAAIASELSAEPLRPALRGGYPVEHHAVALAVDLAARD